MMNSIPCKDLIHNLRSPLDENGNCFSCGVEDMLECMYAEMETDEYKKSQEDRKQSHMQKKKITDRI